MELISKDGISFYVLPDCAKCKVTNKNPMYMDECPILNFDDFGDYYIPELCDEYVEEWDK